MALEDFIPVVGDILNFIGNERTNKSNEDQNELNRQFQHDESDIARTWQEDQYKKYYSPQAQVEQLKQAGINPFISGGQGAAAGSMPSPTQSNAPSSLPMSAPTFGGFAQAGQMLLQDRLVTAQEENYRAQAERDIIDSSIRLYKELGEDAGDAYLKTRLSELDSSSQSRASEMYELQKQANQIANARANIMKQVEGKYSMEKAAADLSKVNYDISKIVGELNKMQQDIEESKSRVEVNDASIARMATEMARNLAQMGLFNALSNQYETLLPYVQTKMIFDNGMQAFDFEDRSALFEGDTKKRKFLRSSVGQFGREASFAFENENNPFMNLIDKFLGFFARAASIYASTGTHTVESVTETIVHGDHTPVTGFK